MPAAARFVAIGSCFRTPNHRILQIMRTFRLASSRVGVATLVALSSSFASIPAHAVVEQTDGTVVPVSVANCPGSGNATGCIQVGLNIGEGLANTATTNPVNAIFSATTSPEIFAIPQTAGVYGSISVVDMIEGAGFENTFGWYNITAPNQLYAITPCADEPTSTRTVNFQTEFQAGRYLGGFIGFFLITPENAPVGNNCGSIGNVGHAYYTERARNGDGNYVHYLLYQSKVNPLAYYFGFEDLYRGGDNDFEDMFLKVTGLLAPCTPSAEVCDGMDNNCDGLVDNAAVDAGGNCGATDVGACSFGTLACQLGALVCVGAVGPAAEQCNGIDDNCNGVVDDAPAGAGAMCGTDVGECNFGTTQCIGGALVCQGGKGPSLEVCNVLDDDCNGVTDDAPIDSGGPCGSNVGACQPGIFVCVNGAIMCSGGVPGTAEICNGIDDDCNGAIDDGNPGGGTACGSNVGTCKAGVEYCIGGQLTCIGAIGPTAEICDGLDNDCDGTADQLAPCPGDTQCISGSCAEKCKSGEFPCPGGQTCSNGYCVVTSCDDVMCPSGTTCNQGLCIPDGGGGAGGGSTGGNGGSSSVGAGGATGGMGGANSGSSSSGTAGNAGEDENWGLVTGGGGKSCSCSMVADDRKTGLAAIFAVGALAASRRRRNRRNA
jgi:Notch-like protein